MSPVAIRLVVAPLILLVVVGFLWLSHTTHSLLPANTLLLIMGGAGGLEIARLLRHREPGIAIAIPTIACALLGGIGFFAEETAARMSWRVAFLLFAFFALLIKHVKDVRPEALFAISLSTVPVLYVGLPFSFMREMLDGPDGIARCLYVVLIAKGSDIGGWVVGKPFGRHKLIPTVSPGKSWEGLAGGVLLSVLIAVFTAGWLSLPEAHWPFAGRVGFGALLGLASIFAGVTQSGFKRRVGAKDSSTLIPEMGGILDMIDSLLVAAPIAYLVYALVGHGVS